MTNEFEIPVAVQLRQAREDAGLSMREVARRLGMAPNSYRHYEQPDLFKAAYLPVDLAKKLTEEVDDQTFKQTVWALAGFSSHEPMLEEILGVDEAEGQNFSPDDVPADLVPVYSVQASAGHGSDISEEYQEYTLAFPTNYLQALTTSSPKNLSIISVKGDSMEPTILDNDIVLLDMSKTDLNFDGLFVLRFGDALHIKRIGRAPKRDHITILSDNRDLYPPIQARISEVAAVGKVLWYGRKV